jgi:DNA-binding LacI/PurR family transcriptional regulator
MLYSCTVIEFFNTVDITVPKQAIQGLIGRMERDIRADFHEGMEYRSVRELAARFKVSAQTAHKAVRLLVASGILETLPRKGVLVKGRYPAATRSVRLVTKNPDPRFNSAFLNGARRVLDGEGFDVQLVLNLLPNPNSLVFGDFLLSLNANAIIAIGFSNAALGFYHALQKGINIVADIELEELPTLPVVQTNNRLHAGEAAALMSKWGRSRILVASFGQSDSSRHVEFRKNFLKLVPKGDVEFVSLARPESVGLLHRFFSGWSEESGIFTLDYSANHVVAPYFRQHRLSPERRLVVYDAETDHFHLGQRLIPAVGPSLETLGTRLAQKLLRKLQTGEWPTPLVEKI